MCNATSKESPNRSWSSPRKYCPSKQMPRAGDRQELREPLHHPENIASKTQALQHCGSLRSVSQHATPLLASLSARIGPCQNFSRGKRTE